MIQTRTIHHSRSKRRQRTRLDFPANDTGAAASLPSEDTAKSIHETLVNLMLVLIGIHLAGVLVHWLKFRENLVPAMFHGRKSVSPPAVDADRPRS